MLFDQVTAAFQALTANQTTPFDSITSTHLPIGFPGLVGGGSAQPDRSGLSVAQYVGFVAITHSGDQESFLSTFAGDSRNDFPA